MKIVRWIPALLCFFLILLALWFWAGSASTSHRWQLERVAMLDHGFVVESKLGTIKVSKILYASGGPSTAKGGKGFFYTGPGIIEFSHLVVVGVAFIMMIFFLPTGMKKIFGRN